MKNARNDHTIARAVHPMQVPGGLSPRSLVALLLVLSACFVSRAKPEVTVTIAPGDEEQLSSLAQGMQSARNRIGTVRASIISSTYLTRGSIFRHKYETIETVGWIGRGDEFRMQVKWRQTVDGKTDGEVGASPPWASSCDADFSEDAWSGKVLLSYQPGKRHARLSTSTQEPQFLHRARMLHEPLHFGVAVYGASLQDFLTGDVVAKAVPGDYYDIWDPKAEEALDIDWLGARAYHDRETQCILVTHTLRKGEDAFQREMEFLVEPERGFTVPLIQTRGRGGETVVETECIKSGEGIWLPKETRSITRHGGRLAEAAHILVEKIDVNVPVSHGDLRIPLAPGTAVLDRRTNVTYTYQPGQSAFTDDAVAAVAEKTARLVTVPPEGSETPLMSEFVAAEKRAASYSPPPPPPQRPPLWAVLCLLAAVSSTAWLFLWHRRRNRAPVE